MNKITIPCSYQGSKQKLAKEIVNQFFAENEITEETKFYDLCCGSGAITVELLNRGIKPNNITMIDLSVWGLFWKSVGEGTFDIKLFEDIISKMPNEPTLIKDHVEELSKSNSNINTEYIFLVLQSASFGGKAIWKQDDKWHTHGFRDYWLPTETSVRRSPSNPMSPMPNTLLERMKLLIEKAKGINAIHMNVTDFNNFKDGSIIYIDPPYSNTTGYGYDFDLLNYIKSINKKCYVSEGKKISENAIKISKSKKSGITGKRKSSNEEWINIFND